MLNNVLPKGLGATWIQLYQRWLLSLAKCLYEPKDSLTAINPWHTDISQDDTFRCVPPRTSNQ